MDNQGLVWVDITSDFDPITYAEAFADEEQAGLIRESESVEDSLRALYEWGYLSKRDGRIQFLLPEDELDEASYISKAMAAAKEAKKDKGSTALAKSSMLRRGAARLRGAGKGAAKYLSAMDKKKAAKGLAGAGVAVGSAMAARAFYKKMRSKKDKKESLDDNDLEDLLDFAEDLGFEFESWDDIDEALEIGEYIDDILTDAENDGLTETYSEEDIVTAALSELEEEESLYSKSRTLQKGTDFTKKKSSLVATAKGKLGKMRRQWRTGRGAPGAIKRAGSATGGAFRELGSVVRGSVGQARAFRKGGGSMRGAATHVGKSLSGMSGGAKAAGAGLAIGGALAARALYKKMKNRRKSKSEDLDTNDLNDLVQDSIDLGFQFESYDELLEAIRKGEFIDSYLEEAAANGLTETHDETDLVIAALEELEETDSLYAKAREAAVSSKKMLPAKYSHMRAAAGRIKGAAAAGGKALKKNPLKYGGIAAASAVTTLAARAAYRKMKKRKKKKNESIEFSGYRSSAEGGIYESAPIPFGTGNNLHAANLVKKVWDNLDR